LLRMNDNDIEKRASALMQRLDREAEAGGYHLNPDTALTLDLCRGLTRNIERYGYMACPCRLADGKKDADMDIICPCDYRDPDLEEYGACYCALYVNEKIKRGEAEAVSIPERRPPPEARPKPGEQSRPAGKGLQVWRCRVCGYLCAREAPPEVCPICKAKKERFEVFQFEH
jgi:ferredoxin-thioredoxin reductase catalytic chain